MKRLPLGLKIIGTFFIVFGVVLLWRALSPTSIRYRMVTVGLVMSGPHIIAGLGLFAMKRWARWTAIGLGASTLLLEVFAWQAVPGVFPPVEQGFVFLLWGIVVLWYFMRPSVKAQFVSRGRGV